MKKVVFLILALPLFFSCSKGTSEVDNSGTYVAQNQFQINSNEFEQAKMRIQEYEKLLQNEPDNIGMRISLATNYYFLKEYDKAIENFSKILDKNKDNLEALIGLGNINYDIKKFDKAIEYYQFALTLDPNNIDVRCDMGTSYKEIGMTDIAIKEFKKCIEQNFNHINAHHNLATVLFISGNKIESDKEMRVYDSLMAKSRQ